MRSPRVVLDNLIKKEKNFVHERLYRNFYNEKFYLLAYEMITNKNADESVLEKIEKLINDMKVHNYQPSSNKKHTPLRDQLILSVLEMILNGVYHDCFLGGNHSFQNKLSAHTALRHVQGTFRGARWFIKGDLTTSFYNMDHHKLIHLLRKRIKDERFIDLIWKLLNTGILVDWKSGETWSGSLKASGVNGILSNIYFHELDVLVGDLIKKEFDQGNTRKINKEYKSLQSKLSKQRIRYKKKWEQLTDEEKNEFIEHMKSERKRLQKINYNDHMDEGYKRIQYVRYANTFFIGVIGSRSDCEWIKRKIHEVFQLEITITNSKKRTRFLGYDVMVSRNKNKTRKTKNGYTQRTLSYVCQLLLPHEVWRNKLFEYKAIKVDQKTKQWRPKHREFLLKNDNLEILRVYNMEIKYIYNYYKLANDSTKLSVFKYMMEYSMYKTLANKYKTSMSKIIKRYKRKGVFQIYYQTKEGLRSESLYSGGFKRQKSLDKYHTYYDNLPSTFRFHSSKNSYMARLSAGDCKVCHKEKVELHHKNKLKSTENKPIWKRKLIERESKTIPLCSSCHKKLHLGKLD